MKTFCTVDTRCHKTYVHINACAKNMRLCVNRQWDLNVSELFMFTPPLTTGDKARSFSQEKLCFIMKSHLRTVRLEFTRNYQHRSIEHNRLLEKNPGVILRPETIANIFVHTTTNDKEVKE